MMDSQENALQEGIQQEETERKVYATKQEVLERVKELAHGDEAPEKDEVDLLKTTFYKLHIAEREAALKKYLDEGGDPEAYQVMPDEAEEAFKAEMTVIKERRAQIFRQMEAEKADNLKRKEEIIEKIKAMTTSPEEVSKAYQEFKALQQEWREIKAVPAEKASELWRNYQLYVEQFYDLLKMNIEARELDFKKNLELKTRLCEQAEALDAETDVVAAFAKLQQLHLEYREVGPVAKEQREEIWARFKAASTVINKKHQQHFEGLRAREEENLAKKTALCEKVEAVAAEENKGNGDWERHTKAIVEAQQEWKTIGFATQKMNTKIFERFRSVCDTFFKAKSEYYRAQKDIYKANADKKRALIEQARALADSTEWKATADKLVALQQEWKTIGIVPRKLGDQLWEEFRAQCNKFFDARNAQSAGQRDELKANLAKKRDVIARINALADTDDDDKQTQVRALMDEYAAIGHVPFRDKDKVYEEYHAACDKVYDGIRAAGTSRRLNNFRAGLKQMGERGAAVVDNERTRLLRQYDAIKQEVQTYENNLGFLTASSKKGSSFIDEINRKIEKLKADMQLVKDKIKAIDAENAEKEQ